MTTSYLDFLHHQLPGKVSYRLNPKLRNTLGKVQSELTYQWNLLQWKNQLPVISTGDRAIVQILKKEGVCVTSLEALALPATPPMLKAAHHSLLKLPHTCSGHADARSIFNHAVQVSPNQIVWDYPDLFLWGLQERLLEIVENYIGLPISYFGPSLRKDIVNGKQVGTRLWHKDPEDRRMVKILVYLNDVSNEGGPFEYIPKRLTPSPRAFKNVKNQRRDEGMQQVVPPSAWKSCTGSAGTVIFADTAAIYHHGKMPQRERAAIIYTYTSKNPKRPEEHHHNPSQHYLDGLYQLTQTLSPGQKECLFWKTTRGD
jgi:hypothetical protein